MLSPLRQKMATVLTLGDHAHNIVYIRLILRWKNIFEMIQCSLGIYAKHAVTIKPYSKRCQCDLNLFLGYYSSDGIILPIHESTRRNQNRTPTPPIRRTDTRIFSNLKLHSITRAY